MKGKEDVEAYGKEELVRKKEERPQNEEEEHLWLEVEKED